MTTTATRHTFTLQSGPGLIAPDDWMRWCETDDDRIQSDSAQDYQEVVHVTGRNRDDARAYLASVMPDGYEILDA